MVFVLFILAAIITVLSAIKLSTYADVLSHKTKVGSMLLGFLLLAGVTSLPELTTGLTALYIENVDLAMGNMVGSNLFNIFIIAGFDLYFRRQRIFSNAAQGHAYTAALGAALTLIVLAGLFFPAAAAWGGISLFSVLLVAAYAAGTLSLRERMSSGGADAEPTSDMLPVVSVKQAKVRLFISAGLVVAAGSILSITGDQIALTTPLGSSWTGSFLIAASTSLPEAVVVLIAIQLANINLAISSIAGSNLFNLVLIALLDAAYRPQSVFFVADDAHIWTAFAALFLSLLFVYSLISAKTTSKQIYSWPSVLMIIVYFIFSIALFLM
ncbi:cation:H+ antiporter [Salsuginibacillus halophilus]|uniref:Cation:H+ antiporter n=1 Tax=Salsuginibacillus halophilus TaxID=517424 RepID=A0A2P8HXH7_9BACI|nr:sodium:calcium antiporter [Salsuginibacillus halophilus]PSL50920.1 cation:H+ antiporter [Salsuginibacillus halophilus]